MEYTLKDKLNATSDFIEALTEKGWQEIEHIQNQLANLSDTVESKKVGKLLNSLLTSYYVFVGGLENFNASGSIEQELAIEEPNDDTPAQIEPVDEKPEPDLELQDLGLDNTDAIKLAANTENEPNLSEPFEYFVDFDEPIGEPITDEDLYNN